MTSNRRAASGEQSGGGPSWAAGVEAEARALRAMAEAIADDERARFARLQRMEMECTDGDEPEDAR